MRRLRLSGGVVDVGRFLLGEVLSSFCMPPGSRSLGLSIGSGEQAHTFFLLFLFLETRTQDHAVNWTT